MVDIAELTVRIKADAAQLASEMNKVNALVKQASGGMQQSNNALSASFSGIKSQLMSLAPALSAVAFVSFAKGALNAADRLNDLSQRTGIAASTLSALNIPLLQGGSNVEEFASSINRMNNAIGEAASNQSLTDTFNSLGLSIKKLRQLSPEQQFYEITKALNSVKNQADFTKLGMDIFGRSFTTLAPLIRGADGNLANFVETAKKTGKALSEEDLKRIDDFGDAWTQVVEELKISFTVFTPVLEGLIAAFQVLRDLNPVNLGSKAGEALGNAIRGLPSNASFARPDNLSNEEAAASVRESLAKLGIAKGTNPNVNATNDAKKAIDDARKSLADYNQEMKRHSEYAALAPKEQAGMEAYYKTLDLAQKAGIKNAETLAEKNRMLAESNYAIKEAQDEARRSAQLLTDKLSDGLTNAIMDFKSAGDAANQFARSIASMIIQRSIATPIANALTGGSSGGGGIIGSLFSSFGLPSFDVGTDRVPHDMIAQIHQDEMIIPAVEARSIRNGGGNGSIVNVYQTFQISNDVPALIEAHIRNSAPTIASAAHDAVFASIQRGGAASKLVGNR